MKFTGLKNIRSLKLDVTAYEHDLRRYLTERMLKSGRIWLETATEATPIPTWSGASRSTFQNLASALGTTVAIGPIVSKKDRTDLGRSTGEGGTIIQGGKTQKYQFYYGTSLRYLVYNEYNTATRGRPPQPYSNSVRYTPYHFQEKARAAWEKFAGTVKLPNPYDKKYLKVSEA